MWGEHYIHLLIYRVRIQQQQNGATPQITAETKILWTDEESWRHKSSQEQPGSTTLSPQGGGVPLPAEGLSSSLSLQSSPGGGPGGGGPADGGQVVVSRDVAVHREVVVVLGVVEGGVAKGALTLWGKKHKNLQFELKDF